MLLFASLAIILSAAFLCRRQVVRLARERRQILSNCADLFDEEPRRGVDRAGFGTLSGQVRGWPVHVGLLAESLAFRRLPQLWLRVEVRVPMGTSATLNVIRRSSNVEFYAPATELLVPYEVPAGWPLDTLIRGTTDSAELMRRVAGDAEGLLIDPRLKEILVTPRGVRLSTQAREGSRGAYLLFRSSRFGNDPISRHSLLGALDNSMDLAQALRQQEYRHAGIPATA